MSNEPLSVAGLTVKPSAGGVELVTGRSGRAVRIKLSHREAAALATGLLRAVPEEIGRELLAHVLDEIVAGLPEDTCIQLGLSLLARHSDAIEARALFDRAQRAGTEIAEA